MEIQIKRVRETAEIPKRQTEGSAGYDLKACLNQDITVWPGESQMIPTGISIAIPSSLAAFIYARSSLGIKHGIIPSNAVGVIDSDYRGEIFVGLYNYSENPFTIHHGDRIAQMLFQPIETPNLEEVVELPETVRGTGGFGSTGRA